jgi:hypothetical protein
MTNRFFAGQTNFIEELNLLDGESGDAQQAIDDHIADTTAAHAASAISNTPAGNIAATTVQGAINELDTEKLSASATTLPSSFVNASLNSITPTGGALSVTGSISATGQVNASAFATTGYLASTYSTKLLLAGESADNFVTFIVTNGAGRMYYMGPGVGDGVLTTFALYDNNSGTTRWRSTATGFDVTGSISATGGATINSITPTGGTLGVTGIQTITANSSSAGLTVAQSGAGPAATFTGGNVLIGTTINDVYRLDVNGPFRAGNSTVLNMDVFGIQAITANSSSPGLTVTQSGAGPCLRLTGLPTSAAGLSAGDIWNDSGTLKVA